MAVGGEEALGMNDGEADDRIAPIVTKLPTGGLMLDAGRQPEDQIERLIRGEGELARQVQTVVSRSRAELGINVAAEIVPIVLLYRRAEPDYVVITPVSPSR
jgi:hypothetical protein